MSPPNDRETTSTLRDEAVEWLVRVQSDAATAEDWVALTGWLETSAAHAEAFAQAERLSDEISGNAAEIAAATQPVAAVAPPLRPGRGRSRRWLPLAGLAAAAAVVAAVAAPGLQRAYEGAPTVYRTGVGETREIALADGTRIHLDAASTMSVRLGWRRRSVDLAQAQASFDVAKNPGRPFVIDAGDQQIRVIGTEFNVRRFDGTVVVTVRRGVVEVDQPDLGPAPVARLASGRQLRHREGTSASRAQRVDPDAAFAWRDGRLICDDEPLPQIVAELNRRYVLPIHVTGAAGAKRFSGVLDMSDQGALVRRLADYLSLSVRRTERDITLS
ncbi:MAG: FecR family protein [Caulobacterales bacterium]|jgi:transmembrane sensor